MRQARTGARASVADERYRAHRAVRRLLELLAAERPLVIVLDDVHWSDDASIELLAALLRREADAPVLIAAGFRPGQASPALAAALAAPSVQRLVLGPLDEAHAIELLGAVDAGDRRLDLSRRRRQSVLPRAAAPFPRGRPRSPDRRGRGRRRGRGHPRTGRRRGLARRGAGVAPGGAAGPAPGCGGRGRAVRARPRGLDRRASRSGGARRPGRARSSSTSSARRRCHAASSSATRSCAARSTRRLRPVGDWPPTRARPRASQRKERRRPSRHTTSSSTRLGATRQAVTVLLDAGTDAAARAPAAAARWLETALELLPATDDRRVDVYVALASSLRALGELDRSRAALLEAIELPAERGDGAPGRADGTLRGGRALVGEPRRCAPPPHPGLGGAARRDDCGSRRSRDRARRRRTLRVELRAGGRDGPAGTRDSGRRGGPGSARVSLGRPLSRRDGGRGDRHGPRAP